MRLLARFSGVVALLALTGLYGWLSYYQIEADEQGVVLRLGRYARSVGPGPHFYAPPLETLERRRVIVERAEFGFRTVSAEAPQEYQERPLERRMITGDQNIVDAEFVVQYRIADLAAYLFNARDPDQMIRDVAQAAIREVVSLRSIDEVLREERRQIALDARERIQELADAYGLGLSVQQVALQEVQPPHEVQDAFRDVASAEQDKQRLILEAQGYADQIVPQARGEAEALLNEARAYRETRILEAQGEAARFSAILTEYEKAPAVTRERLYIETLEAILPDMEKIIVEEGGAERVLPYLPVGRRGETP